MRFFEQEYWNNEHPIIPHHPPSLGPTAIWPCDSDTQPTETTDSGFWVANGSRVTKVFDLQKVIAIILT